MIKTIEVPNAKNPKIPKLTLALILLDSSAIGSNDSQTHNAINNEIIDRKKGKTFIDLDLPCSEVNIKIPLLFFTLVLIMATKSV